MSSDLGPSEPSASRWNQRPHPPPAHPQTAQAPAHIPLRRLVPSRIVCLRRYHRKCLLLHGERRLDMELGGLGLFMPEQESDHRPVVAGLQEVHRPTFAVKQALPAVHLDLPIKRRLKPLRDTVPMHPFDRRSSSSSRTRHVILPVEFIARCVLESYGAGTARAAVAKPAVRP